ncbi:MAG: hypothetical protein Q9171_000187 [Xanthocarpia ochracea]
MSTARTDDGTDPDSRVAQRTPGYSYDKAKKRAGRGERERKSREAKWRAREAAQLEAGEIAQRARARKQHRLVKNRETTGWAMMQVRRWLDNEQRKLDKGGLTEKGVEDFIRWTRLGSGYGWMPTEQCENANIAIKRFLDEMKAAQQARGNDSGLRDWWVIEPPRSRSLRKKWAKKRLEKRKAMDELTAKGDQSVVEPSGKASMAMDVDPAEHDLVAGERRRTPWTLEAVPFRFLRKSEEDGNGGPGHAANSTQGVSKQLPLKLGDLKAREAYGRELHNMAPEPLTLHISEESMDADFDTDDMAPEPVSDADFTEDEETL